MSEHKLREPDGCTVVDVAPAYTREVFLELLDMVGEVVSRGRPRLILNMDKLPHITSEGIGLLVLVHDKCTEANGRMVLANVPQRVERVLKLAGVLNFFSIHPDEPAAIEALRVALPDVEAEPSEPIDRQAPACAAEAASARRRPAEEGPQAEEQPSVLPLRGDAAEAALREIVSEVIKSRRHQQVIDFFMKRSAPSRDKGGVSLARSASLDEIAGMTAIPRPAAERVMQDLAAGGLVSADGERFTWEPSVDAQKKLDLFRRALSDPKLRSRVLAWIYAEEKKV